MSVRTWFRYLFVLAMLFVSASVWSQSVTATYQNESLTKVLNKLGAQYKLTFAFDNQLLDTVIVSKSFTQTPIQEVLTNLLLDTNLGYVKSGDVYMIIPNAQKTKVLVKQNNDAPRVICQISGVIKDRLTGEQLPYAVISVPGTNHTAQTNSNGYFNLIAPACDSIDILIQYIGYKQQKIRTSAQTKPPLITFFVDNDVSDLKEVLVEKKSEILENSTTTEPSRIKLNTRQLSALPSLSELDITAPLQLMPGIDGSTETSTGFLIRKSLSDKNLILYDGFSVYQIDHFFGSFSSINSKAVKDIQVYKSGFDARLGGRTAGLIEITAKSGNMYKPVIDVSADMLSVDASIELPLVKNRLSLIVAGRQSYTEKFKTPLFVTLFNNVSYDMQQYYRRYPQAFKSNEGDPVYSFADLHSKVSYKLRENQVFSLSYFLSSDKLRFSQNYQYPSVNERANWGTQGISFRYTGNITNKWQHELVLGQSITRNNYDHYDSTLRSHKIRRLLLVDTASHFEIVKNKILDNSFSYSQSLQLHPYHTIQSGLSLNRVRSEFFSAFGTESFWVSKSDTSRNYDKQSVSVCPFLQHQYNDNKLIVKSGVRFNYYNCTQKFYPEIRFQLGYKITPQIQLKASAGNYHQFTNKIQIIKNVEYQNAWVVSDGDLFPVVSSRTFMIGTNYAIGLNTNIDIEVYNRKTDDLTTVFTFYRRDVNGKLSQMRRYLYGNNTVNGIDILVRHNFGKYQIWLAYTLSRSTMLNKKVNNNKVYFAPDDQLHEFKVLNTYKIGGWQFSLTSVLGSGKVWYDAIFANTIKEASEVSFETHRLPVYFRTDVGLSYAITLKAITLSTGCNVFNVFDIQNLKTVSQKLSTNALENLANKQSVFEQNEVYGLGFAPNVFLNFRF